MEARTFNTQKLSFINRLKENLTAKIIGLFFLVSILLISSKTDKSDYNYIIAIAVFFIFIFIIIIPFINSKRYIHTISIEDDTLKLVGLEYNKDWSTSLNIPNVKIEIIQRKNRSGKSNFLIAFKSNKKKYTINRLENWNNFTLYELYIMFKNSKQEKIILDEKFVLDELEQKARDEYEWKDN